MLELDLDHDRHYHRLGAGQFLDESFELNSEMLLQQGLVLKSLSRRACECCGNDTLSIFEVAVARIESTYATRNNFRRRLQLSGFGINCHDQSNNTFVGHLT